MALTEFFHVWILARTAIARLNPKACPFNECTLWFHKFFSVSLTLDLLRWSRDQSTTIPSGYTSAASAGSALILELTAMPTRPHILPHPHQIPTRNLCAFTLGGIPVMNLRNKCVQLSSSCALYDCSCFFYNLSYWRHCVVDICDGTSSYLFIDESIWALLRTCPKEDVQCLHWALPYWWKSKTSSMSLWFFYPVHEGVNNPYNMSAICWG